MATLRSLSFRSRKSQMAVLGLGTFALVGVAGQYHRVVERRGERLRRLRNFAEHGAVRVPAADFKPANFDQPVIITGLIDDWPARRRWSFQSLRARIGQVPVDCGSMSADGVPFYVVAHNAQRERDGSHDLALYVFDSDFSPGSGKEGLLDDWTTLPLLTSGDVFAAGKAGEHPDRPVYRWLLAGPPGSGSPLHQDPWGYSSWNASLVGRKRWVFFPPGTPREKLLAPRFDLLGRFATAIGQTGYCSAAEFFEENLLSLRDAQLGHVELLQQPGDVVAFPADWWHAVVNLEATLAVTESFGERRNLSMICAKLRAGGLSEFAQAVAREMKSLG